MQWTPFGGQRCARTALCDTLAKGAARLMTDSADNGVHDCLHYCVPDAWIELYPGMCVTAHRD